MKKLLISIGAVVVAIALIVSIALFLSTPSPFVQIKGEHVFRYSPEDRQLYIIYNGKIVGSPIECDAYDTHSRCADLSAALFSVTNGKGNEAKTAYYVANADVITALPDDNLKYLEISKDGKSVTATDPSEGEKKIYLYNISDQSKREFAYVGNELRAAVYSESFNSIIYTSTSVENKAVTLNLNLYTNGESVKLASDMYPLAVSDDGERIYAYVVVSPEPSLEYPFGKGLFTLYELNKNGEKVKIAESFNKNYFYFNKDCSQIIYLADGKAFFREYGAESPVRLGSATSCTPIYPAGTCAVEDFCGLPVKLYSDIDGARAYRVESDKNNVEMITSGFYDIHLTSDGKTLYCLKNESIRRIDVDDPSSEETLIEDKTYNAHFSHDGETVYYLVKGVLYYLNEDNNGVEISDNVKNSVMTDSGMLLYVENDGTLYCSENGSKGKEIAANIFDLTVYRGTATYFTDINNYDGVAGVFYLNDENSFEDLAVGKKFKYNDN